jgi:hypothetical protein
MLNGGGQAEIDCKAVEGDLFEDEEVLIGGLDAHFSMMGGWLLGDGEFVDALEEL